MASCASADSSSQDETKSIQDSVIKVLRNAYPDSVKTLILSKAAGKQTTKEINKHLYNMEKNGIIIKEHCDGKKPVWRLSKTSYNEIIASDDFQSENVNNVNPTSTKADKVMTEMNVHHHYHKYVVKNSNVQIGGNKMVVHVFKPISDSV
ncbi:uncharacterized protein LOC144352607 [Saccoglossus kowalevskii]